MLVACLAQGLSGGLSFFQPYIFTDVFQIERADQGRLTRLIGALIAIVSGISVITFSVLSDRIGRRRSLVWGLCIAGVGFVALPLTATFDHFVLARSAVAFGAGAVTAMAAILVHDYAREQSRGKLVAVGVLAGIIGGFVLSIAASLISRRFVDLELSNVTPMYVAFWSMALLLLLVASAAWRGLEDVTVGSRQTAPRIGQLLSQLFTANRNARQLLSFAAKAVAVFSAIMYGRYLPLWGIQEGRLSSMSPAEAMAAVGLVFGAGGLMRYIWLPIAGIMTDRVNRVAALAVAASLNALGFTLISLLQSPMSDLAYPFAAALGIGSVSMAIAALTLAGQEAPASSRGAIMGGFALWGSIGSIVAFYSGGRAFDYYPTLPFALAAVANLALLIFAVMVYRKSGEPFRLNFEQDESNPA